MRRALSQTELIAHLRWLVVLAVIRVYQSQKGGARGFRDGVDYIHGRINHSIKYVDGEIHTNGVENFWSLLKRGIVGSYHHVSPKYLPLYLDEFVSRFNARDLENGDYVEKVLKGCVSSSNGQLTDLKT